MHKFQFTQSSSLSRAQLSNPRNSCAEFRVCHDVMLDAVEFLPQETSDGKLRARLVIVVAKLL